ncbi:MAG: hypothetical protein HY952_01550 [Elusimicrobia bacterium]|nr:hypothetical protein [Elusimicrobiota bacterium]
MSETMMIFGGWVAAGLTIFLFSFLYKDNPFFKIAEHLYLGAGMGWVFQTMLFQTWIPKVWEPLRAGDYYVLIPSLLGLTLVTQFFPKISWVSRYGFTFIMGYGSGLVIPLTISTDLMKQIGGTISPFMVSEITRGNATSLLNAAIVAIGFICVLFYFFFSVEHKGVIKKASNVGIYFLMLYFGAAFGNTVMGRFSLLYGRFDDLYKYSGERFHYATFVILGAMVLYFIVDHFRTRKPAVEEEAA